MTTDHHPDLTRRLDDLDARLDASPRPPHAPARRRPDPLPCTRLRTPRVRRPVPHAQHDTDQPAATSRTGEPVNTSQSPEKYGVPRTMECPTCGRRGRLELHRGDVVWRVGHTPDCEVLASAQAVNR